MDVNHITMKDAVKIYRMMRYLNSIEYADSIKAMYSEMNRCGFYFSVLDYDIKEVNDTDSAYKWIEVRFILNIVKYDENNKQVEAKQLKKWWTIYCMTKKDISYKNFSSENVWANDTSCDVSGILEACNIKIDSLNYFTQRFF